ncbi:MAG: PilZ domain-containing protein [Gammaproteobacteria bacterium]
MAIEASTRIVHESEIQRQHVRVRLPASIQFTGGEDGRKYPLEDVSAGGFSFRRPREPYITGEAYQGDLVLAVDTVGFSIPVCFEICALSMEKTRVSCRFQDMGHQEIAALRHVISAYLSGELVNTGDMLATLSRENFATARVVKRSGSLSGLARVRALAGTGLALIVGIAAFSYALVRLYDVVAVTHATAAKVAARTYTITMPRDGTFFSLLARDAQVKRGQPLGSFQTALLDVVAGVPGSFKLSPEDLSQLIGQQLKGSLASPCDCVVQRQFVTDAQYVLRNQSVLELVPQGTKPYVLARFHYDEIKRLSPGRKVQIKLNGAGKAIEGTISQLRVLPAQTIDANGLNDLNGLDTSAAITDVIAVIKPSVALALSRIDEPVDIRIDPLLALAR